MMTSDLGNQAVIGGGREAALLGRLNFSSGNANDVRTTPIQRIYFSGINVESSNGKALFAEEQRQRQGPIPHADDAMRASPVSILSMVSAVLCNDQKFISDSQCE